MLTFDQKKFNLKHKITLTARVMKINKSKVCLQFIQDGKDDFGDIYEQEFNQNDLKKLISLLQKFVIK